MAETPKLGVRLMATNDVQKEVVFNEATLVFDTMVSRTALSRQNTPPSSPADGACYIVGTSPSGAWSGRANHIALFFNGWRFYAPTQKMRFFIESTSSFWTYTNTSWAQDAAGTPTTLDDLVNVGGAVPEAGQVLTYNFEEELWLPQDLPGRSPLSQLPDVDLNDIQDGHILAWSSSEEVWVNITPPTGDGGGGAQTLNQLDDVSTDDASTGYVLTWLNGNEARFRPPPASPNELGHLADVSNADEAQPNDVLAWNGATWAPSPAVITYSFLGMVDGPQTFDGYGNHFLVVDPTESYMTFRSLQDLINDLDDFALADLTDVQAPDDEFIGYALTLTKVGDEFRYVYSSPQDWSVSFFDGETELTDRTRSLTFTGFEVEEGDGHVEVIARNALGFALEGDPVESQVNAINFIGGINGTVIDGVLTINFDPQAAASSLGELEDVDLEAVTPLDGHVLRYDALNQVWVASEGSGSVVEIDGEAEAALYELGPFAPPPDHIFPDHTNAPAAGRTLVANRGLFVQPGPQESGVRHAVVSRELANQQTPWTVTARVIPSSFQVTGHAAGVVLQRLQNNAFVYLAISNAVDETQFGLRLGHVSGTGVETILTTERNYYPWLRLGFDGNVIRAWVSADGMIWHNFGSPVDPGDVLGGLPNKVGVTNRSNQAHTGNAAALITYWDDPDFPASARMQQGVVSLNVGGLQDVDLVTAPPQNGEALVWDAQEEKWVPGGAGGGGSVTELDDLEDVDLSEAPEDGQALVWDADTNRWVPGEASGGTADYPDFTDNGGRVLAVNEQEDGVEWIDPPAGGGGDADYPDFDGNAGRFLAVNDEEDGVEWVEPTPSGIAIDAFGVAFSSTGTPDGNVMIWAFVSPGIWTLPAGMADCRGFAGTAPMDDVSFELRKNGDPIGSVTFAGTEDQATFDLLQSETFYAGDRISLHSPSALYSIEDISITFIGFAGN